ncbi:hypothetical protein KBC04_04135 [Candidatus Babeliales bacterium]|nr:hypothetical protein [Candidatus Babeliales bacterium]MBP9843314.1 hypothetical protein [Candidatus Babeliales bacterium]
MKNIKNLISFNLFLFIHPIYSNPLVRLHYTSSLIIRYAPKSVLEEFSAAMKNSLQEPSLKDSQDEAQEKINNACRCQAINLELFNRDIDEKLLKENEF